MCHCTEKSMNGPPIDLFGALGMVACMARVPLCDYVSSSSVTHIPLYVLYSC